MSSDILFLATLTVLIGRILSSPVTPVFHSAQGRHIRPIHCVNKATQESGICMFAWHCLKANGTHLGTCVDRFYFGSCCQIKEGGSDPETEKPSKTTEAEINPNSIESTNQVGIWPDDSSKFAEVTTKLPIKPMTLSTETPHDLSDRPVSTGSVEGATTKNLTGKPSKPVTSSPVTTKTPPSTVSLTLSQELITALPTIVSTSEPSANITTEAPKITSVLTSMLRSSTKAPVTISSSQALSLEPVEITSHPEIPTDAKPVPVILNIQSSVPLGPITTLSSTVKPSTAPTNLQTDIKPPIKLEISTSPTENISNNVEIIDNAQQIHMDIKVQSSFSPIEVTTSLNNEDTTLPEAPAEDSTDSLYYEVLSSTNVEMLLNEELETSLFPETATADDTTLIAFTDTPEQDVSTVVPDVRPTFQAVIVQESTNQSHAVNISQILIDKTEVPSSVPVEAAIDSLLVETESETDSPIETSNFEIDATTAHTVAENIAAALATKIKPETAEESTTPILVEAIPPLINSSTEISSPKVPDHGTETIATDVSIKESNISSINASEGPTVAVSTIKPVSSVVENETSTQSSTVSVASNASSILSQSTEPYVITTTETLIKQENAQVHVTLLENKTNIIDTVNSIMNIVLNLNNSLVSNSVSSTTNRPIPSDKPLVTKQPIEVTKRSTTIPTTRTSTENAPESTTTPNLTSIKIATSEKEFVTLQSTPSSIPTTVKLATKTAPTSAVALSEAPVKKTTITTITMPPTKPTTTLTTATTTTAEPVTTTTTTKPTTTTTTVRPVTPTTESPTTTTEDFIAPYDPEGYKKICGRPIFPEPRIVNGQTAFFGQWPWQISLRQWKTATFLHKCGAALLNENWAITAAHCVDNVQPEDILLRMGEYDLASENEPYNYTERRVQIVASHPKFDPRTFEYDLALLRFYEPVQFQPNIIPICIPEEDRDYIGRKGFVTGWGRLYEDGPLPSKLQQVEVPVISNSECEGMYRSAGYVEHIPRNIFICAGYKAGKQDSCEGDSGGPMVIKEDGHWILGGVISWGIGCAEPNQPGVYTRITEFKDWINQIIVF